MIGNDTDIVPLNLTGGSTCSGARRKICSICTPVEFSCRCFLYIWHCWLASRRSFSL